MAVDYKKPSDVLAVLSDPRRFEAEIQRLSELRDQVADKLGALKTKEEADKYAQLKRADSDQTMRDADKLKQKALAERDEAQKAHGLSEARLQVINDTKRAMDTEYEALKRDRAQFQTEINREREAVAKERETLKQRAERLKEQTQAIEARRRAMEQAIHSAQQAFATL